MTDPLLLQAVADVGRRFSLGEIGFAVVGLLYVAGIVARNVKARARSEDGDHEAELTAAREQGRREGIAEGEEEARWENLERSTQSTAEIVGRIEGFTARLVTANEANADANVRLAEALEALENVVGEIQRDLASRRTNAGRRRK